MKKEIQLISQPVVGHCIVQYQS